MPDNHPDADRRGGPDPDRLVKDADAPDHLSPRSQISGGGGENDAHQRHNAGAKDGKQSSSQEKKHERDGRRPG